MEITTEDLQEGRRQLIVTVNADNTICTEDGLRPRMVLDHVLKPGTLPAGVNVPPQGWEELVSLPRELEALILSLDYSTVAEVAKEAAASTLNGVRIVAHPNREALDLKFKA